MRDNSEYGKIFEGKVPLGYANCSMVEFALAIKTCIDTEMEKIRPDNALISTLINAACIGWELIEKSKVHKI